MTPEQIAIEFQSRKFQFAHTPQAQEIVNEVFGDNYHIVQSQLALPPGSIILDIGANEGMFSILMSHLFPEARIIAIEPVPRTFFVMLGNIARNGCTNIECHSLGIGPPGRSSINLNVNKDGKSGGSSSYDTTNAGHMQVEVTLISLDEVFEHFKIDRCGLLKVDIEGAEYDALYNTTVLPRVDNMVIEIHFNQHLDFQSRRPDALRNWLANQTNLVHVEMCRMNE
jgi:FkbM family methyltransferase